MKIFLDSADINEIKTYIDTGFVDGVTTNPSLIAKSGRNILEAISQICSLVDGPVSAETRRATVARARPRPAMSASQPRKRRLSGGALPASPPA